MANCPPHRVCPLSIVSIMFRWPKPVISSLRLAGGRDFRSCAYLRYIGSSSRFIFSLKQKWLRFIVCCMQWWFFDRPLSNAILMSVVCDSLKLWSHGAPYRVQNAQHDRARSRLLRCWMASQNMFSMVNCVRRTAQRSVNLSYWPPLMVLFSFS